MKKVSLVTLIAIATIGTTFAVNAETKPETFGGDVHCRKEAACMDLKQDSAGEKRFSRHREHQAGKGNSQGMHFHHRSSHSGWKGFVTAKDATKVADADKWQDDQLIVLEGHIIKQVGKKDFVFKDASGEITLEIRPRAWHGTVSPEDNVRIIADVEKSWGKTEVEAFDVEKIVKLDEVKSVTKVE